MATSLGQRKDGGWLVGGGEMGERIRAKDWSATPLGAMEGWPSELRHAVEMVLASPLPTTLTWGDGRIQIYNDAFRALLGGRHPRALGQGFDECWRASPAGAGLSFRNTSAVSVEESQRLVLQRDGHPEETFHAHVVLPVPDAHGDVAGHLHQLIDVTAARRMRAPDREFPDELALTRKELDAFSYAVSHDLRTPLRAIDGFSRALLSEQAPRLDEQGRRYLERIRAATQRMAELIDDLLSLPRITRATPRRERVDLTAISRNVLADLAARDPGRQVEVVVAEGLTADADRRMMTTLCENLLGNAWKFSARRPRARIEVTSERHEGETVFLVRDNGAGFNMEYAKKLFEPFQHLHAPSEFQGRGIGLATVERIVTRHGGRIWAQAAPDQGATFYFTLGERS